MRESFHLLRYRNLVLSLFLGGIFLFIAIEMVRGIDYRNNDFFTFWLAGRMVWTGQDPYLPRDWVSGHNQFGATWIPNTRFVYPLPLALFYAPLGLLSIYHANITWVFLLEVLIFFSVFMMIPLRQYPAWKHYILPVLAGVILFCPTVITLLYGQISGLLFFILTGVIWLWKKEKWLLGSMFLTLIALKPNLGVPILIIVSFWLLIQKRVMALVGIIISGLVLIYVGIIINPNWIVEYWAIGNTKMSQTFGFSPTLWGLSAYITGFNFSRSVILGGIAIAIILMGILYMIWKKHKAITPVWIISIAITTTLLVTPYTWSYDQLLLLIPIIAIILIMVKGKYRFLLSSMVFICLDVFAFALLIISVRIHHEVLNVLIPLIVFIALVFCIVSMRPIPAESPSSTPLPQLVE